MGLIRDLSLKRKLPLLIPALNALVLGGGLAYLEVRSSVLCRVEWSDTRSAEIISTLDGPFTPARPE
jgi:hypothetical protein